jgi:hypothetical protein
MDAWRSALAAPNVQATGIELDLVPLQIAELGRSQAVPIGDQDHGRIAVTMAARFAGGRHQRLDLSAGQILPGAGNWGIYDPWRRVLDLLETHGKALPSDLTREEIYIFSSVLEGISQTAAA